MLDQAFEQVYTKFKLHFYKQVFNKFATREATLTTVESFCMEVIMALGSPTIAEFSNMMNLSTPNAAYKINNLVKKGYVKKVQSETDKREYHLYPTRKYIDYYSISYAYLQKVVDRAKQRFTMEELQSLERMLRIVSDELMPEIPLPARSTEAKPE
ncbi:MarR family transcriptional regulator [uncultured Gemmiger sp.]|uniref:MarR family winged helix-turn-helix transcriptional regulator n=1 Tax=uncultured Gemmiger sp. TaxID=1623490 RepID=UPI0025D59A9B|nr:MarR family transcriptional regulator [uncultured Gemmiger sp.]